MKKVLPILLLTLLFACDTDLAEREEESMLSVPIGFPAPVFPDDNTLTKERWDLGKRLFYDPILSVDGSISCSSCHLPEKAFTDGRVVSQGVGEREGNRNAPTLANVAYHPYLTREGGVPTLEMQILVPVQEHAEFDFNILLIAERMAQDSSYIKASYDAYGRAPDAFVITRAISCFERTLLSGNSRYDQHLNGNTKSLSELEIMGKELFFNDRLACSTCHSGFNFTNYAFENNGLYEEYPDAGRFRLTGEETDVALFKVPSLRNVGVTAPYMHDGSIANLTEVIEHYSAGGKTHLHKSSLIKPLFLTMEEKSALIAFLETLTDYDFLTDAKFSK